MSGRLSCRQSVDSHVDCLTLSYSASIFDVLFGCCRTHPPLVTVTQVQFVDQESARLVPFMISASIQPCGTDLVTMQSERLWYTVTDHFPPVTPFNSSGRLHVAGLKGKKQQQTQHCRVHCPTDWHHAHRLMMFASMQPTCCCCCCCVLHVRVPSVRLPPPAAVVPRPQPAPQTPAWCAAPGMWSGAASGQLPAHGWPS